MKAWAVTDRNDPLYTNIVFAETRGAAMSVARLYPACEDLEFMPQTLTPVRITADELSQDIEQIYNDNEEEGNE